MTDLGRQIETRAHNERLQAIRKDRERVRHQLEAERQAGAIRRFSR